MKMINHTASRLNLGVLALWFLLLPHTLQAAHADTIDVCKSDYGKTWYFAIGRSVFKIDNPNYTNGGPDVRNINSSFAIVPPDAASPVGCQNNPQQLSQFSSGNMLQLESAGYSGNMPKQVQLISLVRYPYSPALIPALDPEILAIDHTAANCRNKMFISRFDDGTFLCSNTRGQLNPLLSNARDYISWEFIISGNLYLTPLGQNLVVNEAVNSVGSGYLLKPDVLFGYDLFLPKNASKINAAYLIDLDKLVQEKLSNYEVQNYPWPTKSTNKATK
jgi:hypothetical protein